MGRLFYNQDQRNPNFRKKVNFLIEILGPKLLYRTITDVMVKDFLKDVSQKIRVHKWKHLSHLKLKFDNCPRVTNQTLRTIGRKIKENTTNLSKLSLNFSG